MSKIFEKKLFEEFTAYVKSYRNGKMQKVNINDITVHEKIVAKWHGWFNKLPLGNLIGFDTDGSAKSKIGNGGNTDGKQ